MSNMNGDLLDDGLQAVMGKERCQDVWAPREKKAAEKVPQKEAASREEMAVDAKWVKLYTVSPMAKVKNCAKQTVLYGGISAVLFWWQQAGLLDPKAAIPSFIVLALLAGLRIGSCMTRR